MPEYDESLLPRHLQLLWGREPDGRRGPRPALTIEEIGQAAVTIADRDGLEAVSMKSVATALGVTSMSLYRYVDSKDDLVEVMLDVAYGPVPDDARVTGITVSWRRGVTAWARALAARRISHPWITRATSSTPSTSPHLLEWTDAGVAAFGDLDLDGQQRMSALLVLDGFVSSHVQLALSLGHTADHPGDARPVAARRTGASGGLTYARRLRLLVDPGRFPALAAAAREAFDVDGEDDPDEFYESELTFGIELVLDGIAALASVSAQER